FYALLVKHHTKVRATGAAVRPAHEDCLSDDQTMQMTGSVISTRSQLNDRFRQMPAPQGSRQFASIHRRGRIALHSPGYGSHLGGFDALVQYLAPRNRELLAERERSQAELDTWHKAHPGPIVDMPAMR
ncbi:hypothetical protein, partial [Pseudomonas syringae group genomosp. 3]|uniref:hypothetical protein n=1 Tax=Pseudomonas syringae group genomosp. 3 TaxID=251701 RepID=UPI00217ECA5C